jgi:hypothetical protein
MYVDDGNKTIRSVEFIQPNQIKVDESSLPQTKGLIIIGKYSRIKGGGGLGEREAQL